jgi:hypothetical protein
MSRRCSVHYHLSLQSSIGHFRSSQDDDRSPCAVGLRAECGFDMASANAIGYMYRIHMKPMIEDARHARPRPVVILFAREQAHRIRSIRPQLITAAHGSRWVTRISVRYGSVRYGEIFANCMLAMPARNGWGNEAPVCLGRPNDPNRPNSRD